MSNESNAFWTVKSYPDGDISADNFELQRAPVPVPGDGEVLVKTTHLVVSPPLRMALGTGGIAGKPLPIGSLMRGSGQGRIVQSNHPDFNEGDLVAGPFGWQEYAVSNGADQIPLTRVQTFGDLPVTTSLHVMGSGGATAFIGLYEYGHPQVGDVVVVSAAAGNVGSIVCQLAKLAGCRVVGIAGSDEKCNWLTETLGIDAAINYKSADLATALSEHCPSGVDIYFDNVGGATLDAVLDRINFGARVVLCGATSQYEGGRNLVRTNQVLQSRLQASQHARVLHLQLSIEVPRDTCKAAGTDRRRKAHLCRGSDDGGRELAECLDERAFRAQLRAATG